MVEAGLAPNRRRTLALAACLLLFAAVLGRAGSAGPDPRPSDEPPAAVVKALYADDGVRTGGHLAGNVLRGAVGVFHVDNLVPALIGSFVSANASFLDSRIQSALSNPDAGFGTFAETGGGPIISSSVVAALFVSGRLDKHHPRWRAATYDMLDASIVNLAYTETMKRLVGRERPNGEDNKSFPSGHASNAFALATCFERHYGWRVSVPAYLVASAVGISRLQRNKHYASDVAAGAALGYVVGRTVARVNGRPLHPEEKRGALALQPILGRRAAGVALSYVF
jgi:membrane-associated phospholipid phosphatase